MKTLLLKEFTWNWRSFRYPALLLVFLFFALLNPVTIKYMNEILARFADFEIAMPDPLPQDAFISFIADIPQLGFLVLIIITMGIVAKEKESGVAGWILSKPVSRWNYLAAKLVNLYAVIILGLGAASAVAYFYTWSLMGQIPVAGVVWSTVSVIAFGLLVASLTFTCSTVLKTPLQAGGVTLLVYIMSGIFYAVIGQTAARKFYPNTLLSELEPLVYGTSGFAEIIVPLAVTLGLSLLLIWLAVSRFAKLEL